MSVKTKKSQAKKLYNLLSDTEAISDGERHFWLENFSNLTDLRQGQLAEILQNGERELQKERDAHAARLAEIDTKCVSQLRELATASGLKAATQGDDEDQANYDEDEIIRTLQQAGEL
ncbi:MAG: hypothetical protein V1936_02310 [Patescibacteria group bacterium]